MEDCYFGYSFILSKYATEKKDAELLKKYFTNIIKKVNT